MAFEKLAFTHTFPASTGLLQYQAVDLSTGGVLIDPSSAGANIVGVLVSSGTTGSTGLAGSTDSGSVQTVQFYGVAKMLAGSTSLDNGSAVSVDTNGFVVAGTTNAKIGVALQEVDSTGGDSTGGIGQQIISVLLFNQLQ